MSAEGFTLDDIDTNRITEEIRHFTVSLGIDQSRDGVSTTVLIGSGTLICWKGKAGILTASHVIEETGLRYVPTLRLGGVGQEQPCDLDVKHLCFHPIGQYTKETAAVGPDLAVIELPLADSAVQLLRARKSFYNLERNPSERMGVAKDSSGLMALSGTLGESMKPIGASNGVDRVRYDGYVGYSPLRKYFKSDEFDYFEVTVSYKETSSAQSYGGMSGGGVWKIPVFREPKGEVTCRSAVLAGVNFYQDPADASNLGIIRCHGVESIYKITSS